jgi:hypothetical protein
MVKGQAAIEVWAQGAARAERFGFALSPRRISPLK